MHKLYLIISFLFLTGLNLQAQPKLKIQPEKIHFISSFDRYEYTYLINEGDQTLRIDSLGIKENFYLVDFENGLQLPLDINPDDTVKLNITLTNFYKITEADTADTILIYSNAEINPGELKIKIDFYDNDYGICTGKVTDNLSNPVENSKIYFFYWGVYLFDSTVTNSTGDYSSVLPKGEYTVAAYKEGYRIMFSGNTPDPFFSESVNIDSGGSVSIDLSLPKLAPSSVSISGRLLRPIPGKPIPLGLVVVRKGRHTPAQKKTDSLQIPPVYAGFVNEEGSYNVSVDDTGYYFIQGFANDYLPTYYNTQNVPTLFWQNADSVLLNSSQSNLDLYFERDSSYGAGKVSGNVSFSPAGNEDFEGITVLVESVTNTKYYAYNFCKADGSYYITNLPYGTYVIVAQKIGLNNATSYIFTIDSAHTYFSNINIILDPTNVENENPILDKFILNQNYPNPFNPSTTISFDLPNRNLVTLKIFNPLGEEIAQLYNDILNAGLHNINFNAANLPSGVYFYRLKAGSFVQTKKMILLK